MIIKTNVKLLTDNGEGLPTGKYELSLVCFEDVDTGEEEKVFFVKDSDFYLLRESILIAGSFGRIKILKGEQMLWT